MSELFTQTNKQKKLFRTEEDIVANIQTQFGMPHTGKDLLLDAKMGPNKDQSSRLDSEPDALSDTGMSDDVGAGDTSGILHNSAGGNKNTITGNGTGPYVMDTYVEDYSLSFTRNEDYWQEHDWGPDTVTFLYTSDATSMAASVLNGDVDYMVMDAPETMELFEANGWELVPQFANAGNVSFVIPITNVPDDPWSNVKVREAVFSHGIDLVGAAAAIVGEAGYHTDAIGYKEATYYDEGLEFTSLDYELAKKMLAEAGYPDGFKTRIVADATTQTQATVIQAELKKLGIEAEVEMPDMNEMQKFWTGENTAGGLMVGAMYFADPILDRLDKFYGPYGYMAGCTDWTDEEYALYDNIRSAKSIEEQDELIYKFCVQFVQKDFHFLPIANAVGRAAVSDRLILGDMASLGISYWNPNMVGCKN